MNFLDVLPIEIQNKIQIMHLDNVINKINDKKTKITAKTMNDLMIMITNHPAKHLTHDNIRGAQKGQFYYDPFEPDLYVIMSMAWHLINDNKVHITACERFLFIMFLLRPVELGLIEFHTTISGLPFYDKTSVLCAKLINTFGCNSLRGPVT